ncbi:MAG: hypothetical protein K2J80_12710, partial [Oscillospiraceae bacterium]|nr:hypothetical protein [Oscillospiraceae bacterium]
MKLKYVLLSWLCAAVMLLSGCGKDLVCENGIAVIKKANIKLCVPEDWSVTTGDDIYEEMYEALSGEYDSVKDLKSYIEDNGGGRLLLNAQSPDGAVGAVLSETDKGDIGAEELLRTVHDTTIFEFRSMDMFTKSSYEEYTWGGVSGVMSIIAVSEKEGDPAVLE